MEQYKFVQNSGCEYFPCHSCTDRESFNCLFCYCPLYTLGDQCGGNFSLTESGIKDCSACLKPHRRDSFDRIMEKMPLVMELARENVAKK